MRLVSTTMSATTGSTSATSPARCARRRGGGVMIDHVAVVVPAHNESGDPLPSHRFVAAVRPRAPVLGADHRRRRQMRRRHRRASSSASPQAPRRHSCDRAPSGNVGRARDAGSTGGIFDRSPRSMPTRQKSSARGSSSPTRTPGCRCLDATSAAKPDRRGLSSAPSNLGRVGKRRHHRGMVRRAPPRRGHDHVRSEPRDPDAPTFTYGSADVRRCASARTSRWSTP